jgi:RHS repeat-associated protein
VERTSSANDAEKFATYYRDAKTGLDYAINRYYWSGLGRFLTADPYVATADGANDPGEPQSWNRYSYVLGDPINLYDPEGLKAEGTLGRILGWFRGGSNGDSAFGPSGFSLPYSMPDPYDLPEQAATWGIPVMNRYVQAGIDNAKAALKKVAQMDLLKCAGLLNGLGNGINVSSIQAAAASAADYVFDGASSPTAGSAIDTRYATIGEQFRNNAGTIAASQINGEAIWVRSELFASSGPITAYFGLYQIFNPFIGPDGGPTNYAQATLLHETLHKFGMNDVTLAGKLGGPSLASQAVLGNTGAITDELLKRCW